MSPVTDSMPAPYTSIVDALLILVRDGKVLLAQRAGTGYADGMWNLPSGKLEDGETVTQAAIREGLEEIGLTLTEDTLRFAHLIHYRNHLAHARIGVFFEVTHWEGDPWNAEPHKCAQLAWWPLNQLPSGTYPYTAEGLASFQRGEPYCAVGWSTAKSVLPNL